MWPVHTWLPMPTIEGAHRAASAVLAAINVKARRLRFFIRLFAGRCCPTQGTRFAGFDDPRVP